MNSLILDLAIVVVFGIFLFLGFKNGILSSFISFVSSVFAGFLSVYFGGKLSLWVYSNVIGPAIKKKAESLMVAGSLNAESFLGHLPKFFVNYSSFNGITPFSLDHIINNNAQGIIPEKISEIFAPVITDALKSIFVVFLFVLFMVALKFIIKFIAKVLRFSLMKKTNTILGGLFGLLKAYVVITVALCCLKSFSYIAEGAFSFVSEENVTNTVIFKEMYNNNPVYEFFKA